MQHPDRAFESALLSTGSSVQKDVRRSSMAAKHRQLKAEGAIIDIDEETAARLINGASSHAALWIANSDKPQETSQRAVNGFRILLEGLRVEKHHDTEW